MADTRKSGRGGKRRGAGRPKGSVSSSTLEKQVAREALAQMVFAEIEPMTRAQIALAKGISVFLVRDASGRWVRTEDQAVIDAALALGEEGRYYWIFTKDPSVQAFTYLANQVLGKPVESVELSSASPIEICWRDGHK